MYSVDDGNNLKKIELAPREFDGVASTVYRELDRLLEICLWSIRNIGVCAG